MHKFFTIAIESDELKKIMKRIRHLIREICPPFLWKLSKKVLNGNKSIDNSGPEYQGVLTLHSMKNLHSGKFAEYYDKYIKLLPDTPSDSMRLRHYMLCLFADLSKNIGFSQSAGILAFKLISKIL